MSFWQAKGTVGSIFDGELVLAGAEPQCGNGRHSVRPNRGMSFHPRDKETPFESGARDVISEWPMPLVFLMFIFPVLLMIARSVGLRGMGPFSVLLISEVQNDRATF
jgi:hypothetical protein